MIEFHQPGSQPIDIPETIPNPAVPPLRVPSSEPKPPVRVPSPVPKAPVTSDLGRIERRLTLDVEEDRYKL